MTLPYLTIGKWALGLVAGLLIAWGLYAGIIRPVTKPNPSTRQEADTIHNYYNQPRVSFGCARWEIYGKEKKDISSSNSNNPVSNPI